MGQLSIFKQSCSVPAQGLRSKVTWIHIYLTYRANITSRYAPFVYDTWKSPEILAIVSKIAGIDLVTEMDFEIGHINISTKSKEEKDKELQALADKVSGLATKEKDDRPIVDWHTDSYPFVCVTMLSDCTNMVGGETALRTGTGDILKVRGPQMVSTLTTPVSL